MTHDDDRDRETPRRDRETPWLEWVAAAIGVALIATLVTIIGGEAMRGSPRPPDVRVRVERVTPSAGGFVVEVRAHNASQRTAAEVTVEGTLARDGETLATSEATLDYVPGHSSRRAGLFFRDDPRAHDLSVRALGYRTP